MSLINKMLQDLDARGGLPGAPADPLLVRPVLRPERRLVPRVALAIALVAVVTMAAWFAWNGMRKHPAVPATVVRAPMPLATVPPGMTRITPPQPVAVPEPVPVAPVVAEAAPAAPAPRRAPVQAAAVIAPPADATPDAGTVTRSNGPGSARTAEGEYRRALADLQDGRVTDAIAALEHTLLLDPRHDAARQTLVGLLVEAQRPDDAMRQLQLGLVLDPRQSAMAMLLARLQLEHGNDGAGAIATLQRTLPYAQGDASYQAFMAGVLQRQQRHGEAIAQYQAALAAMPGNAVWLMGLGISLQAERRNAEALAAFQAALATGMLAGDLPAFVQRRIQQLHN